MALSAALALAGTAMTAHMAMAGESISYPGHPLAVDIFGNPNSLFPASNTSLSGNNVTVNGGPAIGGNVFGGAANLLDLNVTNNRVFINSGTVGSNVYGGYSENGNASHNRVSISSGTVGEHVLGGVSKTGNVTGNTVNISGGSVTLSVRGGDSVSGDAMYNSVFISGGTVGEHVFGAWSTNGNASHNAVTISGGSVGEHVFGGYSENGNATHNTVTITGSPAFTFNPAGNWLLGGNSKSVAAGPDRFTGNTLNVWNYSGSPVTAVENFQFFNFRIPANQSGPVLKAITARLGEGYHNGGVWTPTGRGSTVTAINTDGGAPMPLGSSVTLIDADVVGGQGLVGSLASNHTQGQHGATIGYLWTLDTANNKLTAQVANVGARPETKALSQGYLAGTMLANQGADLIAGKGTANAVGATKGISAGSGSGFGFGTFAAISGGWSKYDTGSHVDMRGLSLMSGLSFGADLAPGRLTLGAFFEYGTGAYDTYISGANGKGSLYHLGVGILGRFDATCGGYVETSFRAGGLHNDYSNSGLRDIDNRRASYDSFAPYYGLHVGAGYVWKFTEAASLDLYAKYFWTRQSGDSLTLATGDPVKFKDIDSHRLRLGGRFAYAINDYVAPYIGAAYEHEFDGRARATTYGYKMPTPDLMGGTGIGELGLNLKPSKDLPLSFDLGVQGYVGKREGVSGSLQVRWEF